jgi:Fur family ferric uptake transcriptional regulator
MDSGEVVEFHDPVIEDRQRQIARDHGFELIDHSLVLYVRKKS